MGGLGRVRGLVPNVAVHGHRYTGFMRSVADALREDTRQQTAKLPPAERIALALRMGDADVAALCEAQGISVAAARTAIARSRRLGRQASVCNDVD